MKAQSHTLGLEIPLKPICLVIEKAGAFEDLWRAIQEPQKSAEQGAKGAEPSDMEPSSFTQCEVLTTSARTGPGSWQGRTQLLRAGSVVEKAARSLGQQGPHISPSCFDRIGRRWRHLSFPSSVFAAEDTASFYFSRLADPSMLQIHEGK